MIDKDFLFAQKVFRYQNELRLSREEARKRAFLEMLNREPPKIFEEVKQCELF